MTSELGDQPRTQGEAQRRAVTGLVSRLPAGWSGQARHSTEPETDGIVEVTSPDGESALLIIEAKLNVVGRDVERLKSHLSRAASHYSDHGVEAQAVVVAPYLSGSVRERLQEAGLSYVDLTGNIRVELSRPGLFLMDRGADADPWRGPGRPLGTLKGEPAARVVRALIDIDKVWSMRELVKESGASTGAAYRVIDYLEREGHVKRDDRRRVHVSDWAKLLRAWSTDYSLTGSNRTSRWIAPRGIPHLLEHMAASAGRHNAAFRHALTGTVAAAEWAPYAPAVIAMTYVSDTEAAASGWGLHGADAGANTLLIEPTYDVMLERTTVNDAGLHIAAPAQVVVDLLTGPGRGPAEAEKLLTWMQTHEQSWRTHG